MLLPLESFFLKNMLWMDDWWESRLNHHCGAPSWNILWYFMYLYLFDAYCEFEWCYVLYIPVELKWKETYWNWSGPPLCYSIWHVILLIPAMSLTPGYPTKVVFAWLGVLAFQWYRCIGRFATVINATEMIWKQSLCPMMKFDLNKFFSWIFTFGFTGKTPWTTTNYLCSLQNNVNQVWELPTVWLNRSWQTPLVQVGLAQGCHCHWVLLVS